MNWTLFVFFDKTHEYLQILIVLKTNIFDINWHVFQCSVGAAHSYDLDPQYFFFFKYNYYPLFNFYVDFIEVREWILMNLID